MTETKETTPRHADGLNGGFAESATLQQAIRANLNGLGHGF